MTDISKFYYLAVHGCVLKSTRLSLLASSGNFLVFDEQMLSKHQQCIML
jgi:hypothetical protein